MLLRICTVVLLTGFICSCNGNSDDEWLKEVDDLPVEARAIDTNTPTHLLNMEHKAFPSDPVKHAVQRVLGSKTVSAVDDVVYGAASLAGGVVEDFGDLVVASIDQLPGAIRDASDMFSKVLDFKKDKAAIMVRGINSARDASIKDSTDKVSNTASNSKIRDSFGKLEEAFGSLVGKLIGVTYKNADSINSAISHSIRRISGKDDLKDLEILPFRSRIVKVVDGTNEHPLSYTKSKIVNFIAKDATTAESEATKTTEVKDVPEKVDATKA